MAGSGSLGESTPPAPDNVAELERGPTQDGGPALAEEASFRVGSRLGRYMLLETLGRGGMGTVFAAYDPELDRRVALKILRGAGTPLVRPRHRQRLLREAQAMARLAHPHVIAVHDVGTIDEEVFIAMEFVEGGTLTKWLQTRRPWRAVRDMFIGAGRGLAAAHDAGLVHRDFKPDNVLVGDGGRAKVTDFGLVRASDPDADASGTSQPSGPGSDGSGDRSGGHSALSLRLTQIGARVGTPSFMAPEQHAGDEADERSDQFAFCVALYEALFDQVPFGGASVPELAAAVLAGRVRTPPAKSDVPGRIRRAVLKGLSRKPADRFPDMAHLLEALRYDPRRGRRRLAYAGATVGLAAVAAWIGARTSEATDAGRDCSAAGSGFEGLWTTERQRALAGAFESTGRPTAGEAWAAAAEGIDRYVSRLVALSVRHCEAEATGALSATLLGKQELCIEALRVDLAAQLEVFADADANVVDSATLSVASLGRPEDCDEPDRLASLMALPDDPERRGRIAAANEHAARTEALYRAGLVTEASRVAQGLRAEILELDWPPLTAEGLLVLADLASDRGEHTEAESLYGRATEAAARSGDDALFVRTWIGLVQHYAQAARELQRALHLSDMLETHLLRLHDGADSFRTQIANARGNAHLALGDLAAAAEVFRQALDTMADDSVQRPSMLNNLGVTELGRGEYETARRLFLSAYDARARFVPHDHPRLADNLMNVAITHVYQGDAQSALRRVDEALRAMKRLGEDQGIEATRALSIKAEALSSAGRLSEARAEAERAMALASRNETPPGMMTVSLSQTLAVIDLSEGAFDDALQRLDRAARVLEPYGDSAPQWAANLALFRARAEAGRGETEAAARRATEAAAQLEAVSGPGHPMLAGVLCTQGEVLLAADELEEGKRALERGLAIFDTRGGPALDSARCRVALAQLEAASHPTRARALALAAAEDLRRTATDSPELQAAIASLLERTDDTP